MHNFSALFLSFFLSLQLSAQDQMYDICPLKIGEEIPKSINITNSDGESIEFNNVLAEEKAIVVFYRGGWCPYCTRHLSALGQIKDEIDSLGYKLYGITLDQFDSIAVSQVKSQTEYEIFSDNKAELVTAFGIGWEVDDSNYIKYRDSYGIDVVEWSGEKHHILPVPAVYIIEDGVIQFSYVNPNYSIRLKPETLLAILRSL